MDIPQPTLSTQASVGLQICIHLGTVACDGPGVTDLPGVIGNSVFRIAGPRLRVFQLTLCALLPCTRHSDRGAPGQSVGVHRTLLRPRDLVSRHLLLGRPTSLSRISEPVAWPAARGAPDPHC